MIRRLKPTEKYFLGPAPDSYQHNSRATGKYDCIAFAAGDLEHRREGYDEPPEGYWPTTQTGGHINCLIGAYQAEGFEECPTPDHEAGFEKVALYADARDRWTHAARLRDDEWRESKLGKAEDIIHKTTDCLEGRVYGYVVGYMKRPVCLRVRFRLRRAGLV